MSGPFPSQLGPIHHLSQQIPSLSPLKLDASLSISDGPTPPPSTPPQLMHSQLPSSSSQPLLQGNMPSSSDGTATNGRPGAPPPPRKRAAANLFIPKKKPRPNPPLTGSQPNSGRNTGNNTPKAVPRPLPNSGGAAPNTSVTSSVEGSFERGVNKGVVGGPKPIEGVPYKEFDLLTGDPGQVDWNIFKFHRIPGNKSIISAFTFPVKLNRKNFKILETGMDIDDPDAFAEAAPGDLLDGLNLQDLKNVIPPGMSAAPRAGTPVPGASTPVPGTSTPIVKSEPGTSTPGGARAGGAKGEKMVPLKGPDGQSVFGPDGQPVMVPASMAQGVKGGRLPFVPGMGDKKKSASGKGKSAAGGAGGGKDGGGRRRGGKKTKQVFMIPEEQRRLKKEERYPWIWEDATGKEVWEGRRIDKNRVKLQLLQICGDGSFRWFPARKQYMFTKLPTWRVPNAEEANERYEKEQRRKNPLYFAENVPEDSGFHKAFRQHARRIEMEDRKVHGFTGEVSMPSGSRALRLVDRGRAASAFDRDDADDADEEVKRELQREKEDRDREIFGMEGDVDEMEYEAGATDDDEKVHADGQEEEEKEYEERLKREWKQANKTDVEIDDAAFMGRKTALGKQGKKIRKMLRGQGDEDLYASDSDEKDPYASQEESDTESDLEERERLEKEKAEKEKAEKAKKEEEEEKARQLLEEKEREAAEKEKKEKGKTPIKEDKKGGSGKSGKSSALPSRAASPKPKGDMGSRASSPAVRNSTGTSGSTGGASGASSMGAGNALTAMRATSPGSPKPRPPMGSAPAASRMGTPLASGTSTPVGNGPIKRKADAQPGGGSGITKKQKTSSPTLSAPTMSPARPSSSAPATPIPPAPPMKKKKIEPFPGCLTQDMVVSYLKERQNQGLRTQTKDAIDRFKPMWVGAASGPPKEGVDIRNKELLIHWIKKVADLTEGNWLSLRKGY